jgi:superfamily II DNA/RNA helicase
MASSNQHGVHSPFVYQYVTKCLYAAPNFKTSKSINVLLKTIAYFKITQVQLVPTHIAIEKAIRKNAKGVSINNPSSELIFMDKLDKETLNEYIVKNNNITNDTIVFVNEIYKTEDTNKLWRSIQDLKQVRVTIDLFYCGLVFFRREQVKEHFKIRI